MIHSTANSKETSAVGHPIEDNVVMTITMLELGTSGTASDANPISNLGKTEHVLLSEALL